MDITTAIADAYLLATGKTTTLTTGSKFERIVALLDYYQRRWAREPGVDWNSLYNPALSIGTVSATDTFDLDTSTIRKLSDREGDTVRIVWSDGVGYTDYDLVPHDTLKDYSFGVNRENPNGFYAAQIGQQLVFNHTFTSNDSQFGGEIFVPGYTFPDAIDADHLTDEVQVDDPDWLTTRTAAEYVRNDITRRTRYPELLGQAKEIMERMKDDNDAQIELPDRPWTPGVAVDYPWS
jgi:hypothetical protein